MLQLRPVRRDHPVKLVGGHLVVMVDVQAPKHLSDGQARPADAEALPHKVESLLLPSGLGRRRRVGRPLALLPLERPVGVVLEEGIELGQAQETVAIGVETAEDGVGVCGMEARQHGGHGCLPLLLGEVAVLVLVERLKGLVLAIAVVAEGQLQFPDLLLQRHERGGVDGLHGRMEFVQVHDPTVVHIEFSEDGLPLRGREIWL
mmetsp:Transcript_49236/g.158955  ORF Transcript_49236/g.158955 Transcript_49236/m.158955 type:complete len:204 (-) Transcript_49236:539-1150(-)